MSDGKTLIALPLLVTLSLIFILALIFESPISLIERSIGSSDVSTYNQDLLTTLKAVAAEYNVSDFNDEDHDFAPTQNIHDKKSKRKEAVAQDYSTLIERMIERNLNGHCTTCADFLGKDCGDQNFPVMKGIDFVQYFVDFKNEDGSYDETKIATKANARYYYEYRGYTFHFLSKENRRMFMKSPDSYIPQYGGFCAFGLSSEFCPNFPWAADCMGPSISLNHWTIRHGKLYFFLNSAAKALFLQHAEMHIAIADERWKEFYKESTLSAPFSTVCVSSEMTP